MRRRTLVTSLIIALVSCTGVMMSVRAWPQTAGVDLGPDRARDAKPGQSITYGHVLTNTGSTTDTFSVDVLSTQGWPVGLTSETHPTETQVLTVALGAQISTSLQVSLTVPVYASGVTEETLVTATSQLSPTVQDTATDTTGVLAPVYLPLLMRRWPPVPNQPTIDIITDPDIYGSYTVSWAEQPARLADTYTLEEATNSAFTDNVREVCTTAFESCQVSGRPADTYHYRVRGRNKWGYGRFSRSRSFTVSTAISVQPRDFEAADFCGEVCVQEALYYFGRPTPQQEINQAGGLDVDRGLWSYEIVEALRNLGVEHNYWFDDDPDYWDYIEKLKNKLDQGHPVLVGVKVSPTSYPEWFCDHFILLVGYDADGFIYNSPSRRLRRSFVAFKDGRVDEYDKRYTLTNPYDLFYGVEFTGIAAESCLMGLTLQPPRVTTSTVTVDGSVSSPCSSVTRLNWQWGDGTSEDHSFPASHTYAVPGTYPITATAHSELGDVRMVNTTAHVGTASDEIVAVPAGEFQMGCDDSNPNEDCEADEQPLHTVYLDAYGIDRCEVTNAQYRDFLNARGNQTEGGDTWLDADARDVNIHQNSGFWQVDPGYKDQPVAEVTWYGARAYCQWRGKRLPTEAEWEKAARGSSDTRMYPWGNEEPNCSRVDYDSCGLGTTPVGSYPSGASPYGALDMAGNVWEWVNDWGDSDYYEVSPYRNPPGPDDGYGKVMRGGDRYDDWQDIRVANRGPSYEPSSSTSGIGLRCAGAAPDR